MASGRKLSCSHLSQLTLKITHLQCFLCLLASVLDSQLSSKSREATYHLYGDLRGKENEAMCLSYKNMVILEPVAPVMAEIVTTVLEADF